MKRLVLAALAAPALVASQPSGAEAASGDYQCVFKTSCSADAGGCESTKVTYGVSGAGDAWTVYDSYNRADVPGVRAEAMDDAVSLRWRAGGVWAGELALTEIVFSADGSAAMSSIGANDGVLGAAVLTGRCEAEGAAKASR